MMVPSKIILNLLTDGDLSSCHYERYLTYISHYPYGTSIKNYIHFGQMVRSGNFSRFDYGEKLNLQFYNQTYPTEYNLSGIYKKILMVVGKDDLMGSVEDNLILKDKLVNSIV